jgi:NodT family efflux transporter outer membrane factor (OMF) lipoprotein
MYKLLSFFLIFGLVACRVGNETQIPDFIPEKDVQQTLNLSKQNNKPLNTLSDIFHNKDLNTLLTLAYTNNLDIKQGVERLQQSRYAFLINSSQTLPMLDAKGSYDFSKANNSRDIMLKSNTFKVGFDASWELDIWGKGYYISRQYFELMKNAEYSLFNLHVSLFAEVAQDYFNLLKSLELLRITKQNLRLQNDILQIVRDKHKSGVADDLALNQAEFRVAQTKSLLPPLEFQIENYKNSLAVLLNILPDKLPISFNSKHQRLVSTPFKYSVKNLYNLPLSVLRSRPDVMMTEALLRSKSAALNVAITNLYPSISLSAAFSYLSNSGTALLQTDNQYYGYSVNILQPIWHWRQLVNNIELQKHIQQEYLYQYNEVLLTALIEIKNAIINIDKTYQTSMRLRQAENKMSQIFLLTLEKYKNGLIDFTDVAEAEENFLSAQNKVVSSNTDVLLALTSFYKAIGGEYCDITSDKYHYPTEHPD